MSQCLATVSGPETPGTAGPAVAGSAPVPGAERPRADPRHRYISDLKLVPHCRNSARQTEAILEKLRKKILKILHLLCSSTQIIQSSLRARNRLFPTSRDNLVMSTL
eukprot:jgi/Botrbrau1/16585/Bobra.0068s0016.1